PGGDAARRAGAGARARRGDPRGARGFARGVRGRPRDGAARWRGLRRRRLRVRRARRRRRPRPGLRRRTCRNARAQALNGRDPERCAAVAEEREERPAVSDGHARESPPRRGRWLWWLAAWASLALGG